MSLHKIVKIMTTQLLCYFLVYSLFIVLTKLMVFAPKIGTKPIRLDATGQADVPGRSDWLGPVADLATATPTGGPRVQVELRSPDIFEVVNDFLVGQELPTL
jgi:hypothetical protein